MNPRLAVAVEAARKASVPNDTIARAINKGGGVGGEKLDLELVTFEGFAPHKVPVIVECLTDNRNRTAPEMRVLFRHGQLGAKVTLLLRPRGHHRGDARHGRTRPRGSGHRGRRAGRRARSRMRRRRQSAGRFYTDCVDLDTVTKALREAGWSVTVVGHRLPAQGHGGARRRAARRRSSPSSRRSTTTTTCTASTPDWLERRGAESATSRRPARRCAGPG